MAKQEFQARENWSGSPAERIPDVQWNRVRRFLKIILLAIPLTLLFVSVPAEAQIPRGPYTQMCQNIHLNGTTLAASCKNNGGRWVSTSLTNVNRCVGDILDANGLLHCSTEAPLPGGSYTKLCQAIYLDGGTLFASCKNNAGQWIDTSLPRVSQCVWGADDHNGTLACDKPPGPYQQTCQNFQVNGETLTANCKNNAGQWVTSSLPNLNRCVGDILDANGSVHCSTEAALPVGPYAELCQAIYINAGTVYASCKNRGGQWVSASLANASQCLWGLDDDNGLLTCRLPSGPYAQMCQNIRLNGTTLSASCKNNAGQWVSTSLPNVNRCVGDTLDANGSLHCSTEAPLPPGSYTKFCQAIYIDGGTLFAACKNNGGQRIDTSLPRVSQCVWGADDIDGRLACDKPPGSYQQTCQNIRLNGALLTASCKNSAGQWGESAPLTVSQCMPQLLFGGDVFNQNGTIKCTPATDVMDFSQVTPAMTPAKIVVKYDACHYGGSDASNFLVAPTQAEGELYKSELNFTTIAIAKLEMHRLGMGDICPGETQDNITQVKNMLLNSHLHDGWQLGTDANLPKCGRAHGELDVAARGLITILNKYSDLLGQPVSNHVLHDILAPAVSGAPPSEQWYAFNLCGVNIPETENHILNSQTSRYLANQLLGIDNEKNGFNAWMLLRLQVLLKNDFTEYDARPYQQYSMMALQNLYDFAHDPHVKLAAQMVLDYESAKFAVSSSGLRRVVPFRRRSDHLGDTQLSLCSGDPCTGLMNGNSDPQTFRFMMLSGMTSPPELITHYEGIDGQDDMLTAAVTSYSIPPLVLDMILNKDHYTYFQRIRGSESPVPQPRPAGIELYSGAAPFLISAGGYWQVSAHSDQIGDELNCYADVGWPLATTLMANSEKVEYGVYDALDYTNFIRIDGDRTVDTVRSKLEAVAGGTALSSAVGDAILGPLGGVAGAIVGGILSDVEGKHIECKVPERHRKNTCVAPGFACGMNPIVPVSFPERLCRSDVMDPSGGRWTFIDASENSECPRKASPGFCAAVFNAGGSSGFFEAAPSQKGSCGTFQESVKRNFSQKYQPNGPNDYVTAMGHRIRFVPNPSDNKYVWGIQSIDGKPSDTNIGDWPLAVGDVINSCDHDPCPLGAGRDGYVTIDNPVMNKRLILDLRNLKNPQRTEVALKAK